MKTNARILWHVLSLGFCLTAHGGIILSENFESPDVSATSVVQDGAKYKKGQLPSNGNWIGSTQGFAADRKGLIHKSFGDYTAPSGNNQACYFGYNNTGITTATTAITETVKLGRKFTLNFDVARDNNVSSSTYTMQLVAFGPSDTDTLRADCRTTSLPGYVLASASGSVTSNDLSKHVTITFQADAVTHAAQLGKVIGIRFLGNTTHPILDNVELSLIEFDADGDGLNDDWEIANFGDLSHDGTADGDNDRLTDGFEFKLGLNPVNPDTNGDGLQDWMGIPGYLLVEQWNQISGSRLSDLYGNADFYQPTDDCYFVTSAQTPTNQGDDYGLRMRGTVVAPVTGSYNFWIAGGGESVLYLSTDATAFNRRKIAVVEVATGDQQWDQFPAQKSAAVQLVAGQSYYIEILMKAGTGADHLAVAWQYTGQTRQIIPSARLKSYVPNANDLDDDGMLDSWETQVGLDPNDNGSSDPNQSAYRDVDGDGMLAFEEYLNGGNPFQVGGNIGRLELDVWKDVPGSTIESLVTSAAFTTAPSVRTWLDSTSASGLGVNQGARMRGTVTPTQSGDYRFYVAGDDAAELWLSPSASRFGKRLIAWNRLATSPQQWTKYSTQRSQTIHLQAGQSYYIEALSKNSTSTDHLSIGWSLTNAQDQTWQAATIGSLAQAANWSDNGGSMIVASAGGDIWNSQDAFAFRYVQLSGDCVLTARIPSITADNEWAKVGVMIRESLAAGSKNAIVLRTGNGRLVTQQRNVINNYTSSAFRSDPEYPDKWIRIARAGNEIIFYSSEDGLIWKQIGKSTISMTPSVYVGIAVSGTGVDDVQATLDQVSYASSSPVTLIPSALLTSVLPDANDLDDDNLPDDWEQQVGLNSNTGGSGMGQYGDPDGDGVNNFDEYQFGGNPMVHEGVPGNLTREIWENQPGGSVHDFVRSPVFQQGNGRVELLSTSEYQAQSETAGYGQRVRGSIVAPASGNYRFWISGAQDFELWLSSDATKFNKRKIATALQWNDGVDAMATLFREWDNNGSQMSQEIHLEAGHQYFIEVLHKDPKGNGHFSVAWSYTNETNGAETPRGLIASGQLRTYIASTEDADDDYLPDSWETFYGLNAHDNGFGDAKEGEYGDFDGDLISNHDEWLLGTNPASADTDGDGFDDYREITFFKSNPTMVDLAAPILKTTVNPRSYINSSGDWYANADGSVSSTVRRGFLTYTVDVAEAGVFLLEIRGRAEGVIGPIEELPLLVTIDGIEVGGYTLRSVNGGQGMVELLTPWLSVGSHEVTVLSDNHVASRRLRVDGLRLLQPAGVDGNADGVPDWVTSQLSEGNNVTVCPADSLVSPLCVEGNARFFEQLSLTSDGQSVEVIRGADHGWYANVSLAPAEIGQEIQPKSLEFLFEGGFLSSTQTVTWKPTDVLTAPDLTIRKGDSLRLTGLPAFGNNAQTAVQVTLIIDGVTVATDVDSLNPVVYQFDVAGEHTVEAHCQQGANQEQGSMKVTVKEAEFGQPFHVLADNSRTWTLPGVGSEIQVNADSQMKFFETNLSEQGYRQFVVDPCGTTERRVLARTEAGGPIVDFGQVFGYRTYRTDETGDTRIIQNFANGDRIVMTSIVASKLPPGGSIRLKIFAPGVTFLDGTIEKILTAADFDVNGIAYVLFNYPAGTQTSVCHNFTLIDANGTEIGQQ